MGREQPQADVTVLTSDTASLGLALGLVLFFTLGCFGFFFPLILQESPILIAPLGNGRCQEYCGMPAKELDSDTADLEMGYLVSLDLPSCLAELVGFGVDPFSAPLETGVQREGKVSVAQFPLSCSTFLSLAQTPS